MIRRRPLHLLLVAPVMTIAAAAIVLTTGSPASAAPGDACFVGRVMYDHFYEFDSPGNSGGPRDGLTSGADLRFMVNSSGTPGEFREVAAYFLNNPTDWRFLETANYQTAPDDLVSAHDLKTVCGF